MKMQKVSISSGEKLLIRSILGKVEDEKKKTEMEILSFSHLSKLLNADEKALLRKFRDIDPSLHGFKGRYLGLQKVPGNLVSLRNQKYVLKGKTERIRVQHLPGPVFAAYKKLNAAMYNDTKRKLLVNSGYRSPAYQLTVFLWYLNRHKFDFSKTIRRVAIPGYSEHGFPKGQAVDFITMNGIPDDNTPTDFSETTEYKWLLENANTFHFYESYPRDNKLGVTFEPWHWQYRKQSRRRRRLSSK